MSIPKEPRQIMINLMYLVLTALLALNVSNEILNAFKTLSLSIDRSNVSIDQKTTEVYNAIKENEKAPGQAAKVKPYRERADLVVKEADAMVAYLKDWKRRLVMEAGGYNKEDSTIPDRMDNIDATTSLLVEKRGGDTLKERISALRKFLLSQVSAADTTYLSPLMPLKVTNAKPSDHNPTGDWSIENFEHMPAIAALALFSKYANDVRSSEGLIINRLFEEAHLKDLKFDTTAAIALPTTSYLLEGQKIEASILLAAFNKSNKPTVVITQGGGSKKDAVNGVVPWETVATGTGLQTVKGRIELNTENGPISKEWKFEYMVGTTGASMGLDKMNVFYIGVANPVTVAAAGYSVEDVSLDIPGARIMPDSTNRKGHYNIWVDKLGDLNVAINAKTKEGPLKKVGGMPIRVRRIPDPEASVGGVPTGSMSASTFRVQGGPAAVLKNFDFAARFQIIQFSFMMLPKGKDLVGPYLVKNPSGCRFSDNKDVMTAIRQAHAGDRIIIEEIKAIGPDNQPRKINSIVLSLF